MNRNQKAQAKKDKRATKAATARRGRADGVLGTTEHSRNDLNRLHGAIHNPTERAPFGVTGLHYPEAQVEDEVYSAALQALVK
jgi:hypothetical protein